MMSLLRGLILRGLIFWLLLATPALAFTHTDSCTNGRTTTGSTIACTTTSTIPANRLIVGVAVWNSLSGATLSSVQDDQANSYTIVDTVTGISGNSVETATFYRNSVTNTPQTITATFSIGSDFTLLIVDVYAGASGLDGHKMTAQHTPTGTDSVASGSFSVTAGDFVYGVTVNQGTDGSFTHGTGFTAETSSQVSGNNFGLSEDATSAGSSANATFTPSTLDNWVTGGMAFLPVIPPGGDSLILMGCCQ